MARVRVDDAGVADLFRPGGTVDRMARPDTSGRTRFNLETGLDFADKALKNKALGIAGHWLARGIGALGRMGEESPEQAAAAKEDLRKQAAAKLAGEPAPLMPAASEAAPDMGKVRSDMDALTAKMRQAQAAGDWQAVDRLGQQYEGLKSKYPEFPSEYSGLTEGAIKQNITQPPVPPLYGGEAAAPAAPAPAPPESQPVAAPPSAAGMPSLGFTDLALEKAKALREGRDVSDINRRWKTLELSQPRQELSPQINDHVFFSPESLKRLNELTKAQANAKSFDELVRIAHEKALHEQQMRFGAETRPLTLNFPAEEAAPPAPPPPAAAPAPAEPARPAGMEGPAIEPTTRPGVVDAIASRAAGLGGVNRAGSIQANLPTQATLAATPNVAAEQRMDAAVERTQRADTMLRRARESGDRRAIESATQEFNDAKAALEVLRGPPGGPAEEGLPQEAPVEDLPEQMPPQEMGPEPQVTTVKTPVGDTRMVRLGDGRAVMLDPQTGDVHVLGRDDKGRVTIQQSIPAAEADQMFTARELAGGAAPMTPRAAAATEAPERVPNYAAMDEDQLLAAAPMARTAAQQEALLKAAGNLPIYGTTLEDLLTGSRQARAQFASQLHKMMPRAKSEEEGALARAQARHQEALADYYERQKGEERVARRETEIEKDRARRAAIAVRQFKANEDKRHNQAVEKLNDLKLKAQKAQNEARKAYMEGSLKARVDALAQRKEQFDRQMKARLAAARRRGGHGGMSAEERKALSELGRDAENEAKRLADSMNKIDLEFAKVASYAEGADEDFYKKHNGKSDLPEPKVSETAGLPEIQKYNAELSRKARADSDKAKQDAEALEKRAQAKQLEAARALLKADADKNSELQKRVRDTLIKKAGLKL